MVERKLKNQENKRILRAMFSSSRFVLPRTMHQSAAYTVLRTLLKVDGPIEVAFRFWRLAKPVGAASLPFGPWAGMTAGADFPGFWGLLGKGKLLKLFLLLLATGAETPRLRRRKRRGKDRGREGRRRSGGGGGAGKGAETAATRRRRKSSLPFPAPRAMRLLVLTVLLAGVPSPGKEGRAWIGRGAERLTRGPFSSPIPCPRCAAGCASGAPVAIAVRRMEATGEPWTPRRRQQQQRLPGS